MNRIWNVKWSNEVNIVEVVIQGENMTDSQAHSKAAAHLKVRYSLAMETERDMQYETDFDCYPLLEIVEVTNETILSANFESIP